jgi:cytochrome P450
VLAARFGGETIPMILRHAEVRAAARDWRKFSSDAPQRVPIPSEENVRSVRQLPIETDPPLHGDYRALVEPFFLRAKDPAMAVRIEALVDELLAAAVARDAVEVVREFALPLQSRALAHLLNVPEGEAAVWIGWGTHVFRDGGDGRARGSALDDYLNARFDAASRAPGEDFFSALTRAEFQGRPLTRAEMLGFANLTFAGGRDTIIQMVASILHYVARRAEALAWLREDPARVTHAVEEFLRVFTPLTHIGRVCPVDTQVGPARVPAGDRVSLCWAAANRDETVFADADKILLERKPNPHVAFGFGPHLCLGAPHARLLLRTLLARGAARLCGLTVVEAAPHVEREADYERTNGFDVLRLRFLPR